MVILSDTIILMAAKRIQQAPYALGPISHCMGWEDMGEDSHKILAQTEPLEAAPNCHKCRYCFTAIKEQHNVHNWPGSSPTVPGGNVDATVLDTDCGLISPP